MALIDRVNSLATAIGTDIKTLTTSVAGKQSSNANLSALSGLTGSADTTNYFTAAGAMALTTLTSFTRSLMSQASQAAWRTALDVYSKSESAALFPGSEMGYAERTINFLTTNITYGSATLGSATTTSAAGGVIANLSITVVGEGRPVDIDFVGTVSNSVASNLIGCYLLIGGSSASPAGELARVQAGAAGASITLSMRKRLVLTSGTSYTFTIGIYGNAAGTTTVASSTAIPMNLTVTRR